jgi:hypothetical protein
MIQRMESSLMRTLKTKDRLCFEAIKGSDTVHLKTKMKAGTVKWMGYLVVVLEVMAEAQEGIRGTRPAIMHPDWSRSRTLQIGRCLQRRGPQCPDQ